VRVLFCAFRITRLAHLRITQEGPGFPHLTESLNRSYTARAFAMSSSAQRMRPGRKDLASSAWNGRTQTV
jgi:hypothetical protein